MADTLRSLAGASFHDSDVIRRLQPPIPPEQAVLDRYTFLPHVRTGIAAALRAPFAWGAPSRASVELGVPVIDDAGSDTAQMTVHVHGPGDVAELATHQVIRTWPRPDAHDTEVDDLVQVEFDRPELPWLFTPCGADGAGRLVPWVTLVLAQRGRFAWGANRGTMRTVAVRRDQLQPLGDAWAWAHAQVMGARTPDPGGPSLEQRVSGANAPFNLSRLVCPRRLAADTAYTAFVVPTFTAGVAAGLGLGEVATLEPAWGTSADFRSGDPDAEVVLPVYFSWSFATGQAGNFESMARKIKPKIAPPGVGRRRVDTTKPWPGRALAADDPGAEVVVRGPIVSPQDPEDYPEQAWPSEAQQQWPPEVAAELVERLNRADRQAHQPDDDGEPDPPLVGPPLYGSAHARQPRIESQDGPAQPPWFTAVNTDPRHRVVAGLGTRVVQHDQEALMVSAWNQVIGVEEANRQLRLAQLALHVTASLHRRHLAPLDDATLLTLTDPVHAKVGQVGAATTWATVGASTLPLGVVSGSYRRLLRTRGPVVHAATLSGLSALEAPEVTRRLTVGADRLTASWVLAYRQPDAVVGVSKRSLAMLTPELAARVAPGEDVDRLVERLGAAAQAEGFDATLTPALVDQLDPARLDPTRALTTGGMLAVLAATPSPHDLTRDDPATTQRALGAALQIQSLTRIGLSANVGEYAVPTAVVRRLDLPGERTRDPETMLVGAGGLEEWAKGYLARARERAGDLPFEQIQERVGRQQERMGEVFGRSRELAPAGLRRVAEAIIRTDEFVEATRHQVSVPDLTLVERLDPRATVPARVDARLGLGTGRIPGWLRPDWFLDRLVEPVMACPRFDHPMYEALDRWDRDWMIPGLGLIQAADMSTLLETNSEFVEAFLVGLNHEMGRELLWREYPTDQRGTYFRSFWTGHPELVKDMHELPWRTGGLGDHMDKAFDKRIVLLVRGDLVKRYPGVVAHAVRQAREDGDLLHEQGVPLLEAGDDDSPRRTLFRIHLAPNMLLVGFDLTETEVKTGSAVWWFTLSENPTEPRFGLDESRPEAVPGSRDDLTWGDFGVSPGAFLDAGVARPLSFTDAPTGDVSTWARTSAEVAYLLFQLPARAAFLGTRMLDRQEP